MVEVVIYNLVAFIHCDIKLLQTEALFYFMCKPAVETLVHNVEI